MPRKAGESSATKRPENLNAKKTATRTRHPSRQSGAGNHRARRDLPQVSIPRDVQSIDLRWHDRTVTLTNLQKLFWPDLGLTKGDLLQYYADMAPFLLPHLRSRAIVMKRYPNGAAGKFFL